MQSVNQRSQFLDYTKGILIFLVVYGHIIQYIAYNDQWQSGGFFEDPIFKAIYIFHMPLFIAISGFLSFSSIQKNTLWSITQKRFFNLILPIICWSILYTFCISLIRKDHSIRNFCINLTIKTLNDFWFLWVLFGAIVTIALLKRLGYDKLYGMIISFYLILLIPNYWHIPFFKYTFPFFCLGYFLAQQREYLETAKNSKFLICAAFFFAILSYYLWSTKTYIYISGMTNFYSIILRYFAGFVASIVALWLNWKLYKLSLTSLRWLLAEIGKGSLYIYILQSYFFVFISRFQHQPHHNVLLLLSIYPISAFLLSFCLLQVGNLSAHNTLISQFLFGRISNGPR